jgi:hypothetical protein
METPAVADQPPARAGFLPRWLGPTLRIGVTIGLMAYVVSDAWPKDPDRQAEFRRTIAEADWRWWIAGLALNIVVQALAGVRWAALARPLGFEFPRRYFVWRFFEGSFFSLCLPSSIGGDAVKAYRIGDTTPRRLLAGCSVLADRLTGLAALGVLVGAARATRHYSLSLPAALAVALGLLVAVLAGFWICVGSLDRVMSLIPVAHPAREFIAKLLPYQQRPSLLAQALGWSFVVQIAGTVAVALAARTLHVDPGLGAWFAVVPLVALIETVPISIGGFGVREKAMQFLLPQHGVSVDKAVAVALLVGLTKIATGLIGGVLFMLDRQAAQPTVTTTAVSRG